MRAIFLGVARVGRDDARQARDEFKQHRIISMAFASTHVLAAVALTKSVSTTNRDTRFWTLLAGSIVLPDAMGFAFDITAILTKIKESPGLSNVHEIDRRSAGPSQLKKIEPKSRRQGRWAACK